MQWSLRKKLEQPLSDQSTCVVKPPGVLSKFRVDDVSFDLQLEFLRLSQFSEMKVLHIQWRAIARLCTHVVMTLGTK